MAKWWDLPPIQGTYSGPYPRPRIGVYEPFGGDAWEMPPCPHEGCPETLHMLRTPFMDGGAPATMCPLHGNADMITLMNPAANIWTVALVAAAVVAQEAE